MDHVKKKIRAGSVENIEVLKSDAARTGSPDEKFDLVFVFGHARAKGAGFAEIWKELHRVLKPDGALSVERRVNPLKNLFRLTGSEGRIDRFTGTGS